MRRLRCNRICRSKATIKNFEQRRSSYSDRWAPMLTGRGCTGCSACVKVCPTGAITLKSNRQLIFKYDACIACRACVDACLPGVLVLGPGIGGASSRNALTRVTATNKTSQDPPIQPHAKSSVFADKIKIFAKSMSVREVDCGSCNACELEIAALGNPVYDAERFGIHIVASPRHADVLFITGPVTRQMELALRKTYAATPEPKLIVAVGACACSGGLYGNTQFAGTGVDEFINVDLYIPGCPPSPWAILSSILSMRP